MAAWLSLDNLVHSDVQVTRLLNWADFISFRFLQYHTVWGVEPVVTHHSSWLESKRCIPGLEAFTVLFCSFPFCPFPFFSFPFLSFLFFSFLSIPCLFFTWASGVHNVDRPSLSHVLWRVQIHQIKGVIPHLDHKLWVRDTAGGDVVSPDLDAAQSSCCLSRISIALKNKSMPGWLLAPVLLFTAARCVGSRRASCCQTICMWNRAHVLTDRAYQNISGFPCQVLIDRDGNTVTSRSGWYLIVSSQYLIIANTTFFLRLHA